MLFPFSHLNGSLVTLQVLLLANECVNRARQHINKWESLTQSGTGLWSQLILKLTLDAGTAVLGCLRGLRFKTLILLKSLTSSFSAVRLAPCDYCGF